MTTDKVWPCEHIKLHGANNKWIQGAYFVDDDWDTCPVKGCNAKRPEEPKALWEAIQGDCAVERSDVYIKSNAIVTLKWFRENLPKVNPENWTAHRMLVEIKELLDKELEKCK